MTHSFIDFLIAEATLILRVRQQACRHLRLVHIIVNVARRDSISHKLLLLFGLIIDFVLTEEIDQVTLMWLEGHLTRKLMHTELLNDFKNVYFLYQLLLRILKQLVIFAQFRPTTEA